MLVGVNETEIVVIKREQIIEKVKHSVNTCGEYSYFLEEIVEATINFLKKVISKLLLPHKPEFHGDMAKFDCMEEQSQEFILVVKKIQIVNEQEIQPLKARYESLNLIYKAKDRKAIEQKLKLAVMHKNSFQLQLSSMIERSGYQNIRQLMDYYNMFSSEVSKYEAELDSWKMECRENEIRKLISRDKFTIEQTI